MPSAPTATIISVNKCNVDGVKKDRGNLRIEHDQINPNSSDNKKPRLITSRGFLRINL
jgi:hypothetical protein